MTILIRFFPGLIVPVAVFVAAILVLGLRRQRSARDAHSRFRGDGGVGDGSGGTSF